MAQPIIDIVWLQSPQTSHEQMRRNGMELEAEHARGVSYRFFPCRSYARLIRDGFSTDTTETKAMTPDAVVLFGAVSDAETDLYTLIGSTRRRLGCPVAGWMTRDPEEFDRNIGLSGIVDHLFSNDRNTVGYYGRENVSALPLPAFEFPYAPSGLSPDQAADQAAEAPSWDFVFCGTASNRRIQIIEGLSPALSQYRTLVVGNNKQGSPVWPTGRLSGITFQERRSESHILDLYRQSAVVLNLSHSGNISNRLFDIVSSTPTSRLYEVAALGVAQAAFYDRPEILQDFAHDEIAVFSTLDEFAALARRLIAQPEVRRTMAQNARARVRERHLYRHRFQKLAETLLGSNAALAVGATGRS